MTLKTRKINRFQGLSRRRSPSSDLHNLHLVNFGGCAGISEYIDNNIESFRNEIAALMKHVPKHKDERISYLMAASDWCFVTHAAVPNS